MNVFDHWRDQELKSTMTRLTEENARLRMSLRLRTIVYWACLSAVVVLVLMKLYGG